MQGFPTFGAKLISIIFVISWAKKKWQWLGRDIGFRDKRSDLGDLICQLVVELKS